MATLATNQISPAGFADITTGLVVANAGGDKVRPGPGVFLLVKNADASSKTVTINDPNSAAPAGAKQFDADVQLIVAAGKEGIIGPLSTRFADPSDGLVWLTYSAVTSVTVGAFSV